MALPSAQARTSHVSAGNTSPGVRSAFGRPHHLGREREHGYNRTLPGQAGAGSSPQSAGGAGARRRVRVLRCHAPGGLVRWTEMELTEAEKLKAQRAQRWLYVLIALMIAAPFFVLVVQSQ